MLRTSGLIAASGAGPAGPVFPVANPEVQWMWDARGFSSTLNANSAYVPTDVYSLGLSDAWIAKSTMNKNSWVNSSGGLTEYFPIPQDADLCTNANTSNGIDINTNGGFTFWMVGEPWSYIGTSWGRWFNYWGIASGSADLTTGRNPPSTDQFDGPLIFIRSDGRLEYRRPAGNTYNGNTYQYTSATQSTSNIFYVVISQNLTNGSIYFLWRQSTKTGGSPTQFGPTLISTLGGISAGYGIKNSNNTGRPFFNDGRYSGSYAGNQRFVQVGFANRPYSSSEMSALVAGLENEFV